MPVAVLTHGTYIFIMCKSVYENINNDGGMNMYPIRFSATPGLKQYMPLGINGRQKL